MGHALGGVFHTPHGRAVALFLPYTIEYCLRGEPDSTRYRPLAQFLGLPVDDELIAGLALAQAIRNLQEMVNQPLYLSSLGISERDLESEMDLLMTNALNDSQTVMSSRVPEEGDLRKLFWAAFSGKPVDF